MTSDIARRFFRFAALRNLAALTLLTGTLAALTTEEFQNAVSKLKPGDTWNVPEGVHRDLVMKVGVSGTPGKPIRIRASTPGKTVFSGGSTAVLEGDYLVFEGFVFKDGGIPTVDGHILTVKGNYCRVSDCAFLQYNNKGKQWIRIFGVSNTYSRNWTEGKTTKDPVLQIEVDKDRPNYDVIEGNYFGPRSELGENGGETMRIGYSSQAWFTSRTLVVSNLFEKCDGEIEIISGKSCQNVYLDNTFRNCAGCLTLRHGNDSVVSGNFFLGEGNKNSGGIRVIGAGHLLAGNYFQGLGVRSGGVLAFTTAQPDFQPSGYWTVTNIIAVGNLFADNLGACVDFSSMKGGKGGSQTILPADLSFKENVFLGKTGVPIFTGERGPRVVFEKNSFQGDLGIDPVAGVEMKTPSGLSKNAEGQYLPLHPATSGTPARVPVPGWEDLLIRSLDGKTKPLFRKGAGPLWSREN